MVSNRADQMAVVRRYSFVHYIVDLFLGPLLFCCLPAERSQDRESIAIQSYHLQFNFLHKLLSSAWDLNVQPDSFQADDLRFRHLLGLLHSAGEVGTVPVETSEFVAGVVGLFVHNSNNLPERNWTSQEELIALNHNGFDLRCSPFFLEYVEQTIKLFKLAMPVRPNMP